jgi:hypothetical protein
MFRRILRKTKRYSWNLLISLDQLGNSLLGGDPDETISSRAGKAKGHSKIASALCWVLDKIDANHCEDSIEDDL